MKKYIMLEDDTIEIDGHILYRIESLINFTYVEAGDEGGYIESEENLSHEGECWVFDAAAVYENARIEDNAIICADSEISGNCIIRGNVTVQGMRLSGNCYIS